MFSPVFGNMGSYLWILTLSIKLSHCYQTDSPNFIAGILLVFSLFINKTLSPFLLQLTCCRQLIFILACERTLRMSADSALRSTLNVIHIIQSNYTTSRVPFMFYSRIRTELAHSIVNIHRGSLPIFLELTCHRESGQWLLTITICDQIVQNTLSSNILLELTSSPPITHLPAFPFCFPETASA